MAGGVRIGAAFVEVTADTSNAERDVNRLSRNINGTDATINVDADTGLAARMIAFVARNRTSTINVKTSGLDVAAKAIARMSGARVLGDSLKGVGEGLANIDKAAPKVAMTAGLISNLAAVGLSGASNLLTLAGSLASVAGAGIALPGILGGAAIGMGVFGVAMSDIKKAVPGIDAGIASIKTNISASFWGAAAGAVTNFTSTLSVLKGNLNEVAATEGRFAAQLANSMSSQTNMSALQALFGNLNTAINVAAGAIDPLVASFSVLSTTGSSYLPGLAQGFVDLSTKFNSFVQGAAADGSLKGWIDTGIAGLKSLGDIVGSVSSILYGIYSAATAAGGSSLQTLAAGLSSVATIVNGPAFQGALTQIFSGAAAGASGLFAALGPIGNLFTTLAPTISTVLTLFGQLAGQVLTSLASALSDPAITTGIMAAMTGIQTAVTALLPSIPALAQAFGAVLGVAGQLLGVLGPIFATAISALAPIIVQLAAVIQPLIAALGPALTTVITALMPIIQALIPVITSIVTAITPVITAIAGALVPIITALMPLVTTVFNAIASIITAAMTIVQGIIQVVTGAISGNWSMVWNGIVNILSGVWNTIVAVVTGALNIVGSIISTVWNAAVGVISGAVNSIGSFISSGFNAAKNFVTDAFNGIANAVRTGIDNAVSFVSGLPGQISNALSGLGNLLVGAGQSILDGLLNGLKAGFEGVKNFVGGIADWIAQHKGPKAYDLKLLVPAGGWIMKGLGDGLEASMPKLQQTLSGVSNTIADSIGGDIGINAIGNASSTVSTPGGYGRDLGGAIAAGAPTQSSTANINQVFHVTIDAKSVDDMQKVVSVFNDLGQTARTGRGSTTARIA